MAYHYCENCGDAEMDAPTLRDLAQDNWKCPQCYKINELPPEWTHLAISKIADRLDAIEAKLGISPEED